MAIQEMELDPQAVGQEAFNGHKHNCQKVTKIDFIDPINWSELDIGSAPSSMPI